MEKTMQRKLLEHLANVIEIDYVDLLKYFKEYYPATQTDDYLDAVKDTLVNLLNNRYIKLKENIPVDEIGKSRNHLSKDVILTLDLAVELWGDRLKGKITNDGRHYLADIIRNEKQDELNASFKRLNDVIIPRQNNNQNIFSLVTIFFTVVIIAIQLYQCNRDGKAQKSEADKDKQDSLWKSQAQENALKLNNTLHQISLYLQDTAKVKIVK